MSEMMYCNSWHVVRRRLPKFYDRAITLMNGVLEFAFSSVQEVEIFSVKVKQALEADKPKDDESRVVFEHDFVGTRIIIRCGEEEIARLHFYPVRAVLTYDLDKKHFVNENNKEVKLL